MTLTIKLAPEDTSAAGLKSAESAAAYGWRDTEARVRFTWPGVAPPIELDLVVANAATDGTLVSPATLVAPTTAVLRHVRRYGPHRFPFQWTPTTPLAITDGMTITPIERRRISAWCNAARLIDARTLGLGAGFAAHSFDGLDEVSLTSTVFLDDKNRIDWAADYPGVEMRAVLLDFHRPDKKVPVKDLPLDERRKIVDTALLTATGNIIRELHAKRVQVFAGFYVDSGNPGAVTQTHAQRLLAFVRSKPDWKKFAAELFDFFDSRKLAIDGIWFDFEVASFNAGDKPELERLLREVADKFGERGMYVAFAAAPDTAGGIAGHFESHPASLGQYPNILVRPMSYDTRPGKVAGVTKICITGNPISATALDRVLERCLGHYGLHPAQVQLGTGLCSNESNAHTIALLENWSKQLRPTRAGLIHWNLQNTTDVDQYARCDRNLNGDGSTVFIPRGTFGQPIHGPFNQFRIDAMNAHLPADKQLAGWVDPP